MFKPSLPTQIDGEWLLRFIWLNRELLGASAISLVLWYVPIIRWLIYPIRLFVIYIHEASHCMAAVLTGGGVERFTLHPLNPDYRGLAYTYGGSRIIITSAGYVGSVLFGGLLLVLACRIDWVPATLIGLGACILAFTLRYGRNLFTFFFGVSIAAGLGAIFWYFPPYYAALSLQFLAVQCCLGSLHELAVVFRLSREPGAQSDAQAMRDLTGIPAVIWAFLWALIALGVLGFALRYVLRYS